MKKLISISLMSLALFLLSFSESKATHFAGAEIFYRHIPHPVNPRLYEVTLILYGDSSSGVRLPPTVPINYTSSCNAGGTINVNNTSGITNFNYGRDTLMVDAAYPCAPYNPNDPNSVPYYRLKYIDTLSLPANCNDWVFSWRDFARNNAISNLQNPGGSALYIEARLNNNFGQNSSPRFNVPPVKQFCVKQQNDPPFPLSQYAVEFDGDSILYQLSQPLDNANTPIAWANGYSTLNPITTWNGIGIDQSTGTFYFSPSQAEVDAFKVEVVETRWDTIQQIWVEVGSTSRDLQVPIVIGCSPLVQDGPRIDVSQPGYNAGTITADSLENVYGVNQVGNSSTIDPNGRKNYDVFVVDYQCFDSIVTLKFDPMVLVSSITPDIADEFRIIGPDGVTRPVVGVDWNRGASPIESDEIYLKLHKSLDANGTYVLNIKRGSDGNSLQDQCGFELDPNYIMLIDVKDCPDLNYTLENVTVVEDKDRKIDWTIDDPNYLQPSLFNYWNIGMTVGGTTYSIKLNDINARSYTDKVEFFPNHVDHQNFEYSIQLVQNADFKKPAKNHLTTILLQGDMVHSSPTNSTLNFHWNAYNAWAAANTNYQMEWAEFTTDTLQVVRNWSNYNTGGLNYLNDRFEISRANSVNDGLYAFRVKANNTNNPGGFISESNWIYTLVEYVEPVDENLAEVFAPNVFTPNSDNENDRFYITALNGGRNYPKITLTVFNRWGQMVYEDNSFNQRNTPEKGWDGTSIFTGEKLSDGVYYYVVKLNDPGTKTTKELQGSVTILGS